MIAIVASGSLAGFGGYLARAVIDAPPPPREASRGDSHFTMMRDGRSATVSCEAPER